MNKPVWENSVAPHHIKSNAQKVFPSGNAWKVYGLNALLHIGIFLFVREIQQTACPEDHR